MKKRYAWTDCGPIEIVNGMDHSTAYCRRRLEGQYAILVTRWARNWSEFIGWVTVNTVTFPAKRAA